MNESKLIKNCIAGDSASQRELFDRYTAVLYKISLRYCRSAEDAKDVLQEAWIKIFNGLANYRHDGKFESWMKTIVVNTAIRNYKRLYFKNERYSYEDVTEESVDSSVIDKLEVEEVLGLVNRLPSGYSEVFKLAIIDDYKHKDIAKILGIAESTSRVKLTIARRKIKEMVIEMNKFYAYEK